MLQAEVMSTKMKAAPCRNAAAECCVDSSVCRELEAIISFVIYSCNANTGGAQGVTPGGAPAAVHHSQRRVACQLCQVCSVGSIR